MNRYPIIRQADNVLKSTIKAWKINGFPLAIGFYLLGGGGEEERTGLWQAVDDHLSVRPTASLPLK